jgi:hypothetical protein
MGTQHESGYSADVEGFLVFDGSRIRVAKTNGRTLVLAEPCELPADTVAQLVVIVDGKANSRLVTLPGGVFKGQTVVEYRVAAPF